jgi:hypothetical protein
MYIIEIPYDLDQVTEEHAMIWTQAKKSEREATSTSSTLDLVKQPHPFKREIK